MGGSTSKAHRQPRVARLGSAARTRRRTENPPLGGASIASGYTPAAFARAEPLHPLPLKGRRKENGMQKKTEIVTARMTPKVKAQLQQRAQDANMTLADYLCICGLGQEIIRVEGLDAVLSELKAQGRNLNQLTTLANMGQLTVLRSDELIDKYADLCVAIRRLTKEVS